MYQTENIVSSENIKKVFESDMLLSLVILFLLAKIFSVITVINIPNIPHNFFFADITRGVLENMINDERARMGYAPLTESAKLDQAAQLKAEDMVKKGYFNHISPDGITPWQWISQVGYKYKYAGENLAVGFYDSQDVFQAWLNSPSHKENLLNPNYKEVGTAVLSGFGNNKVNIVVQLFGTPASFLLPAPKKQPVVQQPGITNPEPSQKLPQVEQKQVIDQQPLVETPQVLAENSANQNGAGQQVQTVDYQRILHISNALEDLSYFFFVLSIGALILLIISNFSNSNKAELYSRKFVLRSLVIVAFLVLSVLVDKNLILLIVPNQIII